jgi:hypothetical protein
LREDVARPGSVTKKVAKMKTALTMPACNGNPWYSRFLAACLPFDGSSSRMLPTMTEKARMKTPMSRKRPSETM